MRLISAGDLARLEALLHEQAGMLTDAVAFQISDREFHEVIYRSGGNPILTEMALSLYAYGLDFRRKALVVPGAIARSLADHRRIVAALVRRDAPATIGAADRHLASVYETTRLAMQVRTEAADSPPATRKASG